MLIESVIFDVWRGNSIIFIQSVRCHQKKHKGAILRKENLTCFIYIALLYTNRLFQGFLKQDFYPNYNRNTSRTSAMAETTSNHFGANEYSFILIGLYGTPISLRAIWRYFARTSCHVCYVTDPIYQLITCAGSLRYK